MLRNYKLLSPASCICWTPILALFAVLAFAPSAQADPVQYNYSAGSGFMSVSQGSSIIATGDLNMNGEYIVVDSDLGTLDDFKLTFGPSELITLTTPYGGFDSLIVDNLVIMPDGLTNVLASVTLPDGTRMLTLQSIAVSGAVTAFAGEQETTFNFEERLQTLSATTVHDNGMAGMLGLSLGIFPGELVGEPEGLSIKLDLAFMGVQAPVSAPTPEPSSVVLAFAGALIVGGTIRPRASA